MTSLNRSEFDAYKENDTKTNEIPLSFASFYYSLKVSKGKDEREDVQKKTFTKWINSQLAKIDHEPVKDLFHDLKDGIILLRLLELLTGKELKPEIGNLKMHHLLNLNLVLSTLKDNQIRLINISSNDINEGSAKLTLGLVWNIIQHWQVRDILKKAVYDIHATNLEKALLKWCQDSTKDYPGVKISDFTTSWKDGLAFNAIIHRYRPDLFSYDNLLNKKSSQSAEYFLEHAFKMAQRHLSIERLLDLEDVLADNVDKKSIMMYVMCFFQVLSKPKTQIYQAEKLSVVNPKIDTATITHSYSLKNLPDISAQIGKVDADAVKKPNKMSSSSSAEMSSEILETYLVELKKVIEWLINSESLLNNQSHIGNDVNTVKQQFQTHEDFMLDLTKHQNNVGLVLQEGNRLISNKLVSGDDELEVRKQMKLLNDMWENLRLLAVERQAKLHEILMKLQMEQLNQMDLWLANTENRIQSINQLADSFEGLMEQKEELSNLQDDLVKEQEAVDCLKQIIVVVDDTSDDQAFNDLESKLSNLSDRWSNVCKFVGNRWFIVQDLIIKLKTINSEFESLNEWITNKTAELYILIVKTKCLINKNKLKIDKEITLPNEYASIESDPILTSSQLIKILREIELEMQTMHSKLNDMNEIGEQIGTQLNNSPKLSASINNKMDILEAKWNTLLEQMEYLSKVGTEQQQFELNNKQSLLTEVKDLNEIKIEFDPNESSAQVEKVKNLIENELNEFNVLLNKMNVLFENCNLDSSNLDNQSEFFKVSDFILLFGLNALKSM
ncbi:dystrophin-like isoform X1 [Brachionus plicatilis]|uniref:Dystrophin-like isoform X1 n=1 Tax=Brachionus plicatilis TaxID=10195 RepID=A0A3M7PBD0_BRAPC|nr:dystrophin-like isoform X1 [Brachionus plicatilis]